MSPLNIKEKEFEFNIMQLTSYYRECMSTLKEKQGVIAHMHGRVVYVKYLGLGQYKEVSEVEFTLSPHQQRSFH